MKFKINSRLEKDLLYRKKVSEWHVKFAWWPTRVSRTEVVWFSKYGRKGSEKSLRTGPRHKQYSWKLKPIEDLVIDKLKGTNR